jgi:hypothetical protein
MALQSVLASNRSSTASVSTTGIERDEVLVLLLVEFEERSSQRLRRTVTKHTAVVDAPVKCGFETGRPCLVVGHLIAKCERIAHDQDRGINTSLTVLSSWRNHAPMVQASHPRPSSQTVTALFAVGVPGTGAAIGERNAIWRTSLALVVLKPLGRFG